MLDSYNYGFGYALQAISLPFETPAETEEVAAAMLHRTPADTYPHLTEMIVGHALKPGYSYAGEFEFGLDPILDALERVRDRHRRAMMTRMARKLTRWLTAASVVVVVVAAGAAGCSGERAEPQADDVVKAREAARGRVAPELAVVGDAKEQSRVELDFCREGQYDWKIKEEFRSECQLQTAVAFTFGGDFQQRAQAVHEGLKARGWAENMGVPGSFDVWDKQDVSIARIPSSLYTQGDLRRVWIIFQSSASPPATLYPHLGTADQVNSEKHISTYHATTTGTPWGTAWEQAGRPGPYLVVLKFEDVYHRQPR